MKKGKRILSQYLDLTFFIMIIVCVLLSVGNNKQEGLIINICLFVIVGFIFSNAKKRFRTLAKVSKDFGIASKQITAEFDSENKMLWDKYNANQITDLFTNEEVKEAYRQFVEEKNRLDKLSDGKYTCKIEDYINKELIDSIMRKNVFNLVPGVMTGLGILGTFIGLTMGLQEFNTGSAAEISDSIAPLMDGIKVAFHTSIYGMIFSLVFNYVYKESLEETYNSLDQFLDSFSRFVVGNTDYENEKNTTIILNSLPSELANKLNEILAPSLDSMNATLQNLADNVNKNQVTGLSNIVDHFIEEMNKSLSGKFEELGETIDKTCEMQKQNFEYLQGIYNSISNVSSDVEKISHLSNDTVEKMSSYVSEIESLQKVINESFMSINLQLDSQHSLNEKMDGYVTNLVTYEKKLTDTSQLFTENVRKQIEEIRQINEEATINIATNFDRLVNNSNESIDKIAKTARENLDMFAKTASEHNERIAASAEEQIKNILEVSSATATDLGKATEELSKVSKDLSGNMKETLNNTFESFDENLADITRHLSGTISEIDETTGKVPSVVAAAYEEMEAAFNSIQEKMIELIKNLQDEIKKVK